mmetsp:Transcript_74449/g.240779  ORF Transcript_74449/g.240779 Transcript_74449/m.240779 type:complete len:303 (-) Transcript_74449:555-1463(-)
MYTRAPYLAIAATGRLPSTVMAPTLSSATTQSISARQSGQPAFLSAESWMHGRWNQCPHSGRRTEWTKGVSEKALQQIAHSSSADPCGIPEAAWASQAAFKNSRSRSAAGSNLRRTCRPFRRAWSTCRASVGPSKTISKVRMPTTTLTLVFCDRKATSMAALEASSYKPHCLSGTSSTRSARGSLHHSQRPTWPVASPSSKVRMRSLMLMSTTAEAPAPQEPPWPASGAFSKPRSSKRLSVRRPSTASSEKRQPPSCTACNSNSWAPRGSSKRRTSRRRFECEECCSGLPDRVFRSSMHALS